MQRISSNGRLWTIDAASSCTDAKGVNGFATPDSAAHTPRAGSVMLLLKGLLQRRSANTKQVRALQVIHTMLQAIHTIHTIQVIHGPIHGPIHHMGVRHLMTEYLTTRFYLFAGFGRACDGPICTQTVPT